LVLIDIISTFAFAKHVSEQKNSNLRHVQNDNTILIAKAGICICLQSLVTFSCYVSSRVVERFSKPWIAIWVGYIACSNVVSALWIVLKIRIDRMNFLRENGRDKLTSIQLGKSYPGVKLDEFSAIRTESLLSSQTLSQASRTFGNDQLMLRGARSTDI
jgi:hypothetical protein